MALTIQQVHENNLVAKQWLTVLVAEIKAIRKGQEERKLQHWTVRWKRTNVQMALVEDNLLNHLEEMVMDLKLYFWSHFKTAGLMSTYQSPEARFSTYNNKLLWAIRTTYSVADVPHPINW